MRGLSSTRCGWAEEVEMEATAQGRRPDPEDHPPGVCPKTTHADGGHCFHWRTCDGDCCACGLKNETGDDGKCRHTMVDGGTTFDRCADCGRRFYHSGVVEDAIRLNRMVEADRADRKDR